MINNDITIFSIQIRTGKSLSEAFILTSTNPQYDKNCSLIYQFNTWKQQAQNMGRTCCAHKLVFVLTFRTIYAHNMFSPCSELVVFMYWTGKSMNNLLTYCGLVDPRISASDKDLPAQALFTSSRCQLFTIGEPVKNYWSSLFHYP